MSFKQHCFVNIYNDADACVQQIKLESTVAEPLALPNMLRQVSTKLKHFDATAFQTLSQKVTTMFNKAEYTPVQNQVKTCWLQRCAVQVQEIGQCRGDDVLLSHGTLLATCGQQNVDTHWPVQIACMLHNKYIVHCVAVQVPMQNICVLASTSNKIQQFPLTKKMVQTNCPTTQVESTDAHRDTRLKTLRHFKHCAARMNLYCDYMQKQFVVTDLFVQWQAPINANSNMTVFYFK